LLRALSAQSTACSERYLLRAPFALSKICSEQIDELRQ